MSLTKTWKMPIWTMCFVVGDGGGGGLEKGWCRLQHVRCLLNIHIHQNVLGPRDHKLPWVCYKPDTWDSWQTLWTSWGKCLWFFLVPNFLHLQICQQKLHQLGETLKPFSGISWCKTLENESFEHLVIRGVSSEEIILQNRLPNSWRDFLD